MTNDARPLVGIDVGSTRVSVVVGTMEDDRLVIRGCGQAGHDGARKGVVSNLEEVADAVRVAAEEAEAMASVPVEVGCGGSRRPAHPGAARNGVGAGDRSQSDGVRG